MTWTQQAESTMSAWTEVQKKMWGSWFETMQSFSSPNIMNPNTSMIDQWQKMVSQSLESWTSSADPASKNASRQMVASQAAMMRFMELTISAWKAIAPKVEAGEDWQSLVTNYTDQMRRQMTPNVAGMNQTTQGLNQLWETYIAQTQAFSRPWMEVMQVAPGFVGGSNAEMLDFTKLYWGAFDRTFGSMTGSPSFGFTRELEEKLAKGFEDWRASRQAMDDYQLLVADAWAGVFEQVMREMIQRTEQGKPVQSMRELMSLWTSAADKSFDAIFRSPEYAKVQGNFVNATMQYRISERAIVDETMKYGHFPTRTEMDEAHRNIYELRKEIKALKKALKAKA
jgi:class III poly(R)-hydroxyalkanoic acid synthase PhaE subunit